MQCAQVEPVELWNDPAFRTAERCGFPHSEVRVLAWQSEGTPILTTGERPSHLLRIPLWLFKNKGNYMTIQVVWSNMASEEVDDALEKLDDLLLEVFSHYGEHHQLIKLAEEASELAVAAAKAANSTTRSNVADVLTEFCDVMNVADQLCNGSTALNMLLNDGLDPLRIRLEKMEREVGRINKMKKAPATEIRDDEGKVVGHRMSMADLINSKEGGHS